MYVVTAMYSKLQDLKTSNPKLKTLLSVGGGTEGVESFRTVSATPSNRLLFAMNVIAYLREHNFDGIDIDWEFPTTEDKDQFTEMIKVRAKI